MQTVLASLLGAAATLASLNLVFLGVTVNAYQRDRDGDHRKGAAHFRRLAAFSLVTFIVGILGVAVLTGALLSGQTAGTLVGLAVGAFFVQLAALVGLASYAVKTIV